MFENPRRARNLEKKINGLPWHNPARYQILLMAEGFQLRETELETTSLTQNQKSARASG
jgi:hypothetical protein